MDSWAHGVMETWRRGKGYMPCIWSYKTGEGRKEAPGKVRTYRSMHIHPPVAAAVVTSYAHPSISHTSIHHDGH